MSTIESLKAQIAVLTAEMDGLRRANGTLPSLASKNGKRYAELELVREHVKHALNNRPLRERLCTPMTVGQASIAASIVR